jgi:hypothetical protein
MAKAVARSAGREYLPRPIKNRIALCCTAFMHENFGCPRWLHHNLLLTRPGHHKVVCMYQSGNLRVLCSLQSVNSILGPQMILY